MKLSIGENIRNFRKKNDLTQEELADRLGVTYQSVSRWENGTTYPDLELLPAISELLSVTVDELLGMPQIEKEKRAVETFDELRRECMKQDYDADHIIALLRDIRRNYIDSDFAWRPWSEGNDRVFRDSKILPEVRLFAEAYLERHPMWPHTLETMAEIEDEEHLQDFLKKYTTPFDCSERTLLFNRYFRRGDAERFETERRYQLFIALDVLLCPRYLRKWGESDDSKAEADKFMETMLSLIRSDAEDDRLDMWAEDRMELGIKSAIRLVSANKFEDAIEQLETVVKLLEETKKITDKVLLPTSCRFLDGLEWYAEEDWHSRDNNPDSPQERMILIDTHMGKMSRCYCVYPSNYYDVLNGKGFESLRNHPNFVKLCERVKMLIITKQKEL